MILNSIEGKPLPIYGDGKNVRDWLYVNDHCEAIWLIIKSGSLCKTYNIGGENEKLNIDVINKICEIMEQLYPIKENKSIKTESYQKLITFIPDRPGHDRRYAINCDRIKQELGWQPSVNFDEGLEITVQWYLKNSEWIKNIRSGEYKKWIEKNYEKRK